MKYRNFLPNGTRSGQGWTAVNAPTESCLAAWELRKLRCWVLPFVVVGFYWSAVRTHPQHTRAPYISASLNTGALLRLRSLTTDRWEPLPQQQLSAIQQRLLRPTVQSNLSLYSDEDTTGYNLYAMRNKSQYLFVVDMQGNFIQYADLPTSCQRPLHPQFINQTTLAVACESTVYLVDLANNQYATVLRHNQKLNHDMAFNPHSWSALSLAISRPRGVMTGMLVELRNTWLPQQVIPLEEALRDAGVFDRLYDYNFPCLKPPASKPIMCRDSVNNHSIPPSVCKPLCNQYHWNTVQWNVFTDDVVVNARRISTFCVARRMFSTAPKVSWCCGAAGTLKLLDESGREVPASDPTDTTARHKRSLFVGIHDPTFLNSTDFVLFDNNLLHESTAPLETNMVSYLVHVRVDLNASTCQRIRRYPIPALYRHHGSAGYVPPGHFIAHCDGGFAVDDHDKESYLAAAADRLLKEGYFTVNRRIKESYQWSPTGLLVWRIRFQTQDPSDTVSYRQVRYHEHPVISNCRIGNDADTPTLECTLWNSIRALFPTSGWVKLWRSINGGAPALEFSISEYYHRRLRIHHPVLHRTHQVWIEKAVEFQENGVANVSLPLPSTTNMEQWVLELGNEWGRVASYTFESAMGSE